MSATKQPSDLVRQSRSAHVEGGGGRAVQFDPQRRAGSPRLQQAVRRLTGLIEASEKRARRRKAEDHRKFSLAVEALVCNFVAVGLVDPGTALPLGVPRDKNRMAGLPRYREPVFGEHFLAVLDAMAGPALGWLDVVRKGYRSSVSGKGQFTTVLPTAAFWAALGIETPAWADLARTPWAEPLVLRGVKPQRGVAGPLLDYRETGRTRQLRRQVERLNHHLAAAPVTLLPPTKDFATPIDPSKLMVRRIFNNGSWLEGGRLWGGFWETMEREERFARIRIAGQPIANVDYAQLFLSLLYIRDHHPLPDGDLYDIDGDGGCCRNGWKRIVNAMLFARGPLGNLPDGAAHLLPPGLRVREAERRVAARHATVAHHFGTGIGFRLMMTESMILVAALEGLFAAGITALPLHDSVLVAAPDAESAQQFLQAAAERGVGFRAMVSTSIS